jgi:uncharacterized protein (DUF2062 family)
VNDASDLKIRDMELPKTRPSKRQRVRQSARKGLLWSWRAAKYTFNRLIRSRFTPHQIALGAAIGIFVAWTPTIGLQMAIAVPICLLLRANPVAAIPPIWITNPVTAVPIYSFNYWIGSILIGGPPVTEFVTESQAVLRLLREGEALQGFHALLSIAGELFWPLLLGCVVIGALLAVPTYLGSYFLVMRLRQRLRVRRRDKIEASIATP